MQATRLKILIVDDEVNIRKTLTMALELENHVVKAAANETDAIAELRNNVCDVVFLDMRLGMANGIDLIPQILGLHPHVKIVLITAHASIDTAVEAMRRGAYDYIPKPFTTAQIYGCVRKITQLRELEDRILSLENELSSGNQSTELQSQNPIMQRAIDLARDASHTEATILITGESGTGKGVLARAIHRWSKRNKAPFGVVSCPSLSHELLESELFGHVKGSFTGAIRANPGRIATTEKGTLFLDEVGDLPSSIQPKLLRFLQDHQYEAVGDTLTKSADVRIIAATNVNLREAVKAGHFREDLFYRLNVISIHLPPLRERKQDIAKLAELTLASLRKDKPLQGYTAEALGKLQAYSWPGNIRELHNVVERATLLCKTALIGADDIAVDETVFAPIADPVQIGSQVTLAELEEVHVKRILGQSRSMEEAAKVLGIDVVTLWRRRKKYGI